ncbi:MAG: M28 family peptidase [Chitinophagales bacterium]|nr:M28 family peptidase [Chitinophagales bacterium]
MIGFISEIIQRFGPRLAGSTAEANAQLFVKQEIEQFLPQATLQTFKAPLTAKFRKMKIYAVLYWVSTALFFWNPLAAFVLAIGNAFITVNDLMRNGTLLDFLFPKLQSSNVTAVVEPQQRARQTIVFAGHIDSTEECQWWYWLKQLGGYLTFVCGILIILFAVFTTVEALFLIAFGKHVLRELNWFFLVLAPVQLVYFTFHSKRVVEGAADNLSGIAISYDLLKFFHNNPLQHTRIRFISFGSEEKGLRGSKAYVAANLAELKAENSKLVNIDTIRVAQDVTIVHKETMIGVAHDAGLVQEVKTAFDKLQLPCGIHPLPMGGTDAVPFSAQGIPAISIIGLNTKKLDPTYHTRLDTVAMLEPQALENVKQALIAYVQSSDARLPNQ